MGNNRIAVLGGGSWATAIVKILLENADNINWYMRDAHNIDNIKKYRHNKRYLSSVSFDPNKLNLFDDINKAIEISQKLQIDYVDMLTNPENHKRFLRQRYTKEQYRN
ncbi:MAG: hypothetical protein U9R54_00615, partial [Bacteroidota bacterium]|nr:hypothetical protein [Bacteroidota bacterium]